MQNMKIQNLINPRLFNAAEPLRNKNRQLIFTLLVNRNNLSFNALMLELDIPRQKLAYHLQVMKEYGIISNFYDKREGIKDHSYYELSAFGRELQTGVNNMTLYPDENDIESNEAKVLVSRSANFRTINRVEYNSYKTGIIEQTSKIRTLRPFSVKDKEYIDPWLGYRISHSDIYKKPPDKIKLPTQRQYYLSYKRPFRVVKKLHYKL